MEKIAVVILNFKLKDQTLECIESVRKSSIKNLEIIVVDNASNDGLGEEIEKKEVTFIQNRHNLGYTGGNNSGIKKALELECEWVFIVNPDATVEDDAIEKLVKTAEEEKADIVGPKIYFDNSKTIWHAGGIFDQLNVIGTHIGVDEKDKGQYNEVRQVDFVSGAALMVKAKVFDKIGLFDNRYFLYYEDADFCFRAKEAGFKIMYVPTAIVYHANAQTTGLGSPTQDYFITRNRMLFAAKFLPMRTRIALLREALRNFKYPMRRLALFDFLLGRFGKGSYKLSS